MWAKYKGLVFSRLHSRSNTSGINASFIQLAETEAQPIELGGIESQDNALMSSPNSRLNALHYKFRTVASGC